MNKQTELLINILIVVAIMTLCFVAYNQVLGYVYKKQLLETPCQLCCEINKGFECQKEYNNAALNLTFLPTS